MLKPIPVIIDCDPGHDDAIALLLAFSASNLDVRGVTVTGGNQTLEKTLQNTKNVLEFANIHVDIAAGLDKPLFRDLEIAPEVHGDTGLDGPVIPKAERQEHELNAIDYIRKCVLESETPLTIIATGPLTNIGAFLTTYPELKSKIQQISIMGGSIIGGNWTAGAEFNILVDPEAASIVFESGIPVIMAGLDVTHKALVMDEDVEVIRAIGSKVAVFVAELMDFFSLFHKSLGFTGSPMHDPCAVAYLMKPEIFETKEYFIQIETEGEFTTGATVADQHGMMGKKPNVKALVGVDREAFIQMLVDAMEVYKERGL